MIAEPRSRRKGLAKEVLQLFMCYACREIERLVLFTAKIGDTNVPSLELFKGLGLAFHKHMAVFEQTELRLVVDAQTRQRLEQYWQSTNARIGPSDDE